MQVRVDQEKCQGHNRCYALAPELFDVDDYGIASVVGTGEVPAGLEDKAILAEKNCPEHAITILHGDAAGSEAVPSEASQGGSR
jgi:ferredoxin